MRRFTEAQVDQLERLLPDVEAAVRDLAADHSYRADAMRSIRERLLALFHENRAEGLRSLAAAVHATRQVLAKAPKLAA